jgi:hypothetical protein
MGRDNRLVDTLNFQDEEAVQVKKLEKLLK